MRFTPRAGIADPRIRLSPRPVVPPKPNVKIPSVWSWETQELAAHSAHLAIEGLLDEIGTVGAANRLHDTNEIHEQLQHDSQLQREVYDRITHILEGSRGTPLCRAQARLLNWLRIYQP